MRLLLRRCCHAVLALEGIEEDAEVSITFIDNPQIQELNQQYRNKDKATDVLSFPLGENGVYDISEETGAIQLGDVVISAEKALEQSEIYGHSFQREMSFLTVHSMLHLLGYDHETSSLDAMRMREKEESVLLKLGMTRQVAYEQFDN